jgi:hypothetical protein
VFNKANAYDALAYVSGNVLTERDFEKLLCVLPNFPSLLSIKAVPYFANLSLGGGQCIESLWRLELRTLRIPTTPYDGF